MAMHLEVDELRQWVVSGRSEPPGWSEETERQYRVAEHASFEVARIYSEAGFTVVIDHCRNLPRLEELIETHLSGLDVRRVLVITDLNATLRRNAERTNKTFDPRELEPILRSVHARYTADLPNVKGSWSQVSGGQVDLQSLIADQE